MIDAPGPSCATEIDAERQSELAARLDRYVYDEALSVFLVTPEVLYAVNRHVEFVGQAATLELAETGVTRDHWSRRDGENDDRGGTTMATDGRATIMLEEAQEIIRAATQKAEEIGQPMNVAVVDNGRQLKAFARMEDAWLGSIDIAIDKAFTAVSFLMPTQDLAEMTQPGQPLYGLETTNRGRVVNFAGGILLTREDGQVAGAIGVSGGTVDQDQEVAEAGVAAL